jgi:hypothetical protein
MDPDHHEQHLFHRSGDRRRLAGVRPMVLVVGLLVLVTTAIRADDPYGVTRGGIDPSGATVLKLTPAYEVAQNQSADTERPDDDFQVLFYNTALLSLFYPFTTPMGMASRWDLIDDALLDASNEILSNVVDREIWVETIRRPVLLASRRSRSFRSASHP